MTYLTPSELAALQTSGLDRDAPYLIQCVSQGQLSIARHYGGCKFQGRNYVYIPESDELIRDDVMRWLVKERKPKPPANKSPNGELFEEG